MSRERLADAYEEQAALLARLADVTAQIAHELRGIDSAVARAADTGAEGAGATPSRSSAPVPSFEDLPPEGFDDPPALKPQVDAGLGKCPIHGKPWTIKPAGVSARTKQPFDAFYKCAEKDGDTWCTQKPQKIWRDTHPIREGAAA